MREEWEKARASQEMVRGCWPPPPPINGGAAGRGHAREIAIGIPREGGEISSGIEFAEDATEGVAAFTEKRAPVWKGAR